TALLPLNGPGRFAGDVVEDAVDVFNFVADAVGDALEDFGREAEPVGGHGVFAGDGAEGTDFFVSPFVALYTNAADRQEADEGLPDGAVETRVSNLFNENGVRLAQGVEPFLRHFTDTTHAETWAGEGMAVDDIVRQTEFFA